jgi:hypothetical protein
MRRSLMVAALLLLALGAAQADNLLSNGDFEQPLAVGWTEDVYSLAGTHRFERSDTFGQQTPGQAAKAYKYLAYYASLSQTVDVPGADVQLSFDGRFVITGGSSTCWPVSAVFVHYLDMAGSPLGRTVFYLPSQYCDWVESDSVHFELMNAGVWEEHVLQVAEEIRDNLPAVDAADVRKIKVEMFAYDNGT